VPQQKKVVANRRKLYAILPLLALLFAVLLLNLQRRSPRQDEVAAVVVETAVSPTQPSISSTPTRSPILPAIILPTPTATALPPPPLPNSASITLIGPPDESSILRNSPVSFYWAYTEQLQPEQQFVFILQQGEQEVVRGILREPNLGDSYRFQMNLKDSVIEPGTAVWQIGLQWLSEEQWLIASPQRNLIIMP